jgi:hypothetical protein
MQVSNTGNFGFSGGIEKYQVWLSERKNLWNCVSELNFAKREITILPPRIDLFSNVTVLSLHGCGLTELPQEITQLTLLQKLYLGKNPLDHDKLKSILGRFRSLEVVDLTGSDATLIDFISNSFPHIQIESQDFPWYTAFKFPKFCR